MAELSYRQVAGIVRRPVAGGDLLLLDPRTDTMHVLNPTAGFVWELLQQARTADELQAALRLGFQDVPEEHLAEDVASILRDLSGRGLVERVPA